MKESGDLWAVSHFGHRNSSSSSSFSSSSSSSSFFGDFSLILVSRLLALDDRSKTVTVGASTRAATKGKWAAVIQVGWQHLCKEMTSRSIWIDTSSSTWTITTRFTAISPIRNERIMNMKWIKPLWFIISQTIAIR